MSFNEQTIHIFQSAYGRLEPFYPIIKNHTPIIAYSGGKDSTLLSQFYNFLFINSLCPEPIIFHMDHSIRDNAEQENEIISEMKRNFKKILIKKKTLESFLNDSKKA